MDEILLRKSQEALEAFGKLSPKERFNRLVASGVIDEEGRVPLWSAFLAVVAVKPGKNGEPIQFFRCLKPTLGMPGVAEVDISRESMLRYVRDEGKRVITAIRDKRDHWREREQLHVTSKNYLRTDRDEEEEDNLGGLPEFDTPRTNL